jgi:hypothetical protein
LENLGLITRLTQLTDDTFSFYNLSDKYLVKVLFTKEWQLGHTLYEVAQTLVLMTNLALKTT